jgi:hypothetical protein
VGPLHQQDGSAIIGQHRHRGAQSVFGEVGPAAGGTPWARTSAPRDQLRWSPATGAEPRLAWVSVG